MVGLIQVYFYHVTGSGTLKTEMNRKLVRKSH